MFPDCLRCGGRMALNDETTQLFEFRCPDCHEKRIESKPWELNGGVN